MLLAGGLVAADPNRLGSEGGGQRPAPVGDKSNDGAADDEHEQRDDGHARRALTRAVRTRRAQTARPRPGSRPESSRVDPQILGRSPRSSAATASAPVRMNVSPPTSTSVTFGPRLNEWPSRPVRIVVRE